MAYDVTLFAAFYIMNKMGEHQFTDTKMLRIDFTRFVVYSASLFYFPVAKVLWGKNKCGREARREA